LLRRTLEIVLEFCIMAGELYRGCLDEYQAASLLEDHFEKFCETMATLVSLIITSLIGIFKFWCQIKVLKVLVERGDMHGGSDESPKSSNLLHHLLIRLDKGDWWSKINR
jgi:hypothetical protein